LANKPASCAGFASAARLTRIRFSYRKHDKSGEGGIRRMAEKYTVGWTELCGTPDVHGINDKENGILDESNLPVSKRRRSAVQTEC
jgi:hypothetical protein